MLDIKNEKLKIQKQKYNVNELLILKIKRVHTKFKGIDVICYSETYRFLSIGKQYNSRK
jgi:hypothetical protein